MAGISKSSAIHYVNLKEIEYCFYYRIIPLHPFEFSTAQDTTPNLPDVEIIFETGADSNSWIVCEREIQFPMWAF